MVAACEVLMLRSRVDSLIKPAVAPVSSRKLYLERPFITADIISYESVSTDNLSSSRVDSIALMLDKIAANCKRFFSLLEQSYIDFPLILERVWGSFLCLIWCPIITCFEYLA